MAPTLSASQIATLSLRVFTSVLLFISLILLTTDTSTVYYRGLPYLTHKMQFKSIYAYRYMLASNVIGFAFILMQIAFSVYHIIMGKHLISGDGSFLLDFYGDKFMSYLVATGAAAGFGATIDMAKCIDALDIFVSESYYAKAYASASLLLVAFVCTAILSIISSYALPKKSLVVESKNVVKSTEVAQSTEESVS